MPLYDVFGVVTGSKYLGCYEAATPEDAERMARGRGVTLCHQCSHECEDAEISDCHAEEMDLEGG